MNLAEIQSFRVVGKRLRNARESRGLTLAAVAATCGLCIQELARIESGELLGFKQAPQDTLSHAELYAKALEVELQNLEVEHYVMTKANNIDDELFIPVFLRKK
jgi:transcriptional regulator with XRE-family HTH domain